METNCWESRGILSVGKKWELCFCVFKREVATHRTTSQIHKRTIQKELTERLLAQKILQLSCNRSKLSTSSMQNIWVDPAVKGLSTIHRTFLFCLQIISVFEHLNFKLKKRFYWNMFSICMRSKCSNWPKVALNSPCIPEHFLLKDTISYTLLFPETSIVSTYCLIRVMQCKLIYCCDVCLISYNNVSHMSMFSHHGGWNHSSSFFHLYKMSIPSIFSMWRILVIFKD